MPSLEQVTASGLSAVEEANAAAANAVAVAAPPSRQIYVTIRPDGLVGDGSLKNPYDGSTQARFDQVLATLMTLDTAIPTILHLGPGIFNVTPVLQIPTATNSAGYTSNIPGNTQIIGAGERRTVIRAGIVATDNSTGWVLAQIGNHGGIAVSNLTIDCNMQNQTATHVTVDGLEYINFYGLPAQSTAEYVHVINGGNHPGDPGHTEWFGIVMSDCTVGGMGRVSHCLVDHYQGNSSCTALCATTYVTDNVVVLNNNDPFNLTGKGGTGGFQDAYGPSTYLQRNVCHQCSFGVYSDVDSYDNINIQKNWFDCLYMGIFIYNGTESATLSNILIDSNVITRTYSQAIVLGSGAKSVVNDNIVVTKNVFVTRDVKGGGRDNFAFSIVQARDVQISGNIMSTSRHGFFTAPAAGDFTTCDLSTVAWSKNKYLSGGWVPPPVGVAASN